MHECEMFIFLFSKPQKLIPTKILTVFRRFCTFQSVYHLEVSGKTILDPCGILWTVKVSTQLFTYLFLALFQIFYNEYN